MGSIEPRDMFRPITRERKYLMDYKLMKVIILAQGFCPLKTARFPIGIRLEGQTIRIN